MSGKQDPAIVIGGDGLVLATVYDESLCLGSVLRLPGRSYCPAQPLEPHTRCRSTDLPFAKVQ
jgi:hypothetical protein